MLIKCRFLKNEAPYGREYTYRSEVKVAVGDIVQINASARGMVTEIDIPEEKVKDFADKIKTIIGKVEEKNND